MANGTIFDKALEISTPGFDSLLQTIQTETNRIERNKALARQRKEKIELAQLESNLSLSNQLQMQEERQRDALERLSLQQKFQAEQNEIAREQQATQAAQEKTDKYFEELEEAREDARSRQDKFYRDYGDVYKHNILPEPYVDPARTDSGFFVNVVKDENGDVINTAENYRQLSNDLMPLADFMDKLQNASALVETKNRDNIQRKNTTFITRSNASSMLKRIENMTQEEKLTFAQRVREGEFDTATYGMFSSAPEVKKEEEEEGGPQLDTKAARDFRDVYVKLDKTGTIKLPASFTSVTSTPAEVSLFDMNMEEIRQLDNKLFEHAKLNGVIEQDENGNWNAIDDPSEQEDILIKALQATGKMYDAFDIYLNTKAKFPGASPKDFTLKPDWTANEGLPAAWKANKEQIKSREEQTTEDYETVKDLTPTINW